ncbi:hypothetical protein DFJ74DRAFT_529909 [Hyaloraphidium curvatum]|nr:hypothetical protein DFJ74DRAFT_529909 [Hyaloraphidium curvatum]
MANPLAFLPWCSPTWLLAGASANSPGTPLPDTSSSRTLAPVIGLGIAAHRRYERRRQREVERVMSKPDLPTLSPPGDAR